jgi:hypothetical protein
VADDLLNNGEKLLEKAEREKGFTSLNGIDTLYSQVRLHFDPNFEKNLSKICKVIGCS